MARVDFLLDGNTGDALPQRGQHHPGVHDDQHVSEDVGGDRTAVSRAPRSPDRARARAPRGEAAASHEHHRRHDAGGRAGDGRGGCCLCRSWPRAAPAAHQARGLTGAAEVARAYDAIFDARFADVPSLLAADVPAGPARSLSAPRRREPVVADPARPLQSEPRRGIRDADRGSHRRDRRVDDARAQRAEAWFYLGGAYGARVQWRVLRGARLAAARDGKRIKTRSSGPSPSTRRWPMPTSGSACTTITPLSRPPARRCCGGCSCCPAAIAPAGSTKCCARASGGLLVRERGGLPAAPGLSSGTRNRPGAHSTTSPGSPNGTRVIRISLRPPPKSRTSTSMNHAASLRTWQALLDAAQRGARWQPRDGAKSSAETRCSRSQLDQPVAARSGDRTPARGDRHAPRRARRCRGARAQLQLGDALRRISRAATRRSRRTARASPAAGSDDPLRIAVARARAGLLRAQRG